MLELAPNEMERNATSKVDIGADPLDDMDDFYELYEMKDVIVVHPYDGTWTTICWKRSSLDT